MSQHHHRRGCSCCAPGSQSGPTPNRAELLSQFEERQKDLEQELADVADLIRRFKEERPGDAAGV